MQVDPSIFKAYDIRGIVGRTLDENVAEHLRHWPRASALWWWGAMAAFRGRNFRPR
jgi:hypothetical protein